MAFNVLLVDDSPAMRSFVRRVLALAGFEVGKCLEAGNGREALDVLRAEWVDVILTDINMPVMDGEEFARQLAAGDVLRSIPVLVVSTDCTQARIDRMLALGARGYVTKPFTPEMLGAELEQVLGGVSANA
jgi:two-component system, chemotaxis family, chemotaxis protein CheY